MKKFFFRFSVWHILLTLLPLSLATFCLYHLIKVNFDIFIDYNITALIGFILSIVWLVLACSFHITFDKVKVSITGDFLPKDDKVQYACAVRYDEIISVNLIYSSNDSRDRKIRMDTGSMPKTYIEIRTENKMYRLCVTYYSKYQIKKIINELKKRCKQVGNNVDILDGDKMYEDYIKNKKVG